MGAIAMYDNISQRVLINPLQQLHTKRFSYYIGKKHRDRYLFGETRENWALQVATYETHSRIVKFFRPEED
jgi:hypothetical protein